MKGLYVVRFHFGNGTSERMYVRAYTSAEADSIARPLFNEKFHLSERTERGGVAKVVITQVDLSKDETRKYL